MKRRLLLTCATVLAIATISFSNPAKGQIVITEVMFDAKEDNAWQWIEIKNTGASPIDIHDHYGFNLGDRNIAAPNNTIDNTLDPDNPNETIINPGEVAVIYDGFYANGNPNNFKDAEFRTSWNVPAGVKLISADFFPNFFPTPAQAKSVGFWSSVDNWRMDQDPPSTTDTSATTVGFNNAAFSLDFSAFAATAAAGGGKSITWTGNGDAKDGANWVVSSAGVGGALTSTASAVLGNMDVGNPGVVTSNGTFPANTSGLYITEIMFNPIGSEPDWEWVEVYNNNSAPVNLAGYILDDTNSAEHSGANLPNIATGTIPANGTAILYNAALPQEDFEAAWGPGLNLVPVTDWTSAQMSLNNSGADGVGLWDSVAAYTGDNENHTNAVASIKYDLSSGWPAASNQSIYITTRDNMTTDAFAWTASTVGIDGSFATPLKHPGGDVGSPGTFQVQDPGGQPGDFDSDGDVDGRDFLVWQRDPGVGNLADWQNNYGVGSLAAVGSVPEPTSLALLALALVPVAYGRRR